MTEEAKTCVEILKKAARFGVADCQLCPAYPVCPTGTAGWNNECMLETAANIIESLSAQLDNQEAAIDRIYKQCIELQRNLKELGFNSIAEMYAQLDQVTRERGAAVEDMKIIRSCRQCKTWQEYFKDNGDVSPCEDCDMYSNWQWRGVEVEGC